DLDIVGMGTQAEQPQRPSPFRRKNDAKQAALFLNDRDFGDWHDEPGAPAADIGELARDLVFKVPRQDQHVIGLGFGNLFRRKNRNVSSREIFALLVGISVNRVVEKIGAYAAIVEQGIALARRAVAGDRFAAALRLDQKAQQLALGRANP